MALDPILDAILARHEDLRASGEAFVLDELCREHPDRLDEVRDLIFKLDGLDALMGGSTEETPPSPASLPLGISARLRFRALRPHARGGLGEVFVGWDEELGREVALKLIRHPHDSDPGRRARFLREAEITATLGHPGIVPVFGLGATEDGRPCYAMRFIEGDTLGAAITNHHNGPANSTLDFRNLLSRLTAACQAVAFAHSKGVIHRDLKPSNIMLGPYGETLVVDWGLAKRIGHDDGSAAGSPDDPDGSHTRTGSTLGTPAYMSPEQAAGKGEEVGPTSDVYGAGATLYHLLTGRPPFRAEEHRDGLAAIASGRFPRPRAIKPDVPKPLEAVCLKAMASRPEDRYAGLLDLAADLDRWLAGEPVSAMREPLASRAMRWLRRHRTIGTTAASAVAMVILGGAAILEILARTNADLNKANGDLAAANRREVAINSSLSASFEREKARFGLAMDAIKLFHGKVSEDLLLKQKEFKRLRGKLLAGAAGFYGQLELLLADNDDAASRGALAKVYSELAELTSKIGNKRDALAIERKALAVRRGLAIVPGADGEAKLAEARSLLAVAILQGETGDNAGSLRSFQEARTEAEDLSAGRSAPDAARDLRAKCDQGIGLALRRAGKSSEAMGPYERARAAHRVLADAHPESQEFQDALAGESVNIGLIWLETGNVAKALKELEKAREIFRRLSRARPDDDPIWMKLAVTDNDLGSALLDVGKPEEAMEAYEESRTIHKRLVEANPNATSLQFSLGMSHDNVGWLHQLTGEIPQSLVAHRKAVEIFRKLADDNPTNPDFADLLGTSLLGLGDALRLGGEGALAEAEYRRSVTIHEARVRSQPGNSLYRCRLAEGLWRIGMTRLSAADEGVAVANLRRSIALFETAPAPTQNWDLSQMAYAYGAISGVARPSTAEGKAAADRAIVILRKLVASGYRYPAEIRVEPALDPIRDRPDFRLLMMDVVFPVNPFAR